MEIFRLRNILNGGYAMKTNRRLVHMIGIGFSLVVMSGALQALDETKGNTFGADAAFLGKYHKVIVLQDAEGGRVAVVPDFQGRIMTSGAAGEAGRSYGWINYDLIASGAVRPHMNGYGGEDRFWIGPEGGQYGLFFKKGDPFDLDHWQTPALIDTEPFDTLSSDSTRAEFRRTAKVVNYAGTVFDIDIQRVVRLLSKAESSRELGVTIGRQVKAVAFESENTIRNAGNLDWMMDRGLLSIWILGMFRPTPGTVVVVPLKPIPNRTGLINDSYFGKVPETRLKIGARTIFFLGDGRSRGKIGLRPEIARPVLGSYDPESGVLTVVKFDLGRERTYVNSTFQIQKEPFAGDAVNSYNDGPLPDGSQMGPFYELESSSPARPLKQGESLSHRHATFHFEGPASELDRLARALLGISLEEINSAFAPK